MATKKRATRRRPAGKRKRDPAARKRGVLEAVSAARLAFSRRALGAFLLLTGLFFTAAFITGKGAFLGEAGLAAATWLAGVAGFLLPPLAALAGLLLLLGRLPQRETLGVALL